MNERLKRLSSQVPLSYGIFLLIGSMAVPVNFFLVISFTRPWTWALLLWSAYLVYGAIAMRKVPLKIILLTGAVMAISIGLAEVYFSIQPPTRGQLIYTDASGTAITQYIPADILGYAARPNFQTRGTLNYRDEVVYDVRYTTDEHGLRIAPQHAGQTDACVLFFGGSFTWGNGISDDETLAYQVGELSGSAVWTYNFGLGGAGPHRMLAAVEHGFVDDAIECAPTHMIYVAIPDHVSRSAGLVSWDRHGPRYVLLEDGTAEYTGHFDDQPDSPRSLLSRVTDRVETQLGKSQVYDRLYRSHARIPSHHSTGCRLASRNRCRHGAHGYRELWG